MAVGSYEIGPNVLMRGHVAENSSPSFSEEVGLDNINLSVGKLE